LNGFSIVGPTVCSTAFPVTCSPIGTGNGIDGGNSLAITVINGSVHGMGHFGILLFSPICGCLVEKVHADSNGYIGIAVQSSIVKDNTAGANGFHGIYGFFSTVTGNFVLGNNGSGILMNCPSSVVGNTSFNNNQTNILTTGSNCAIANNANP